MFIIIPYSGFVKTYFKLIGDISLLHMTDHLRSAYTQIFLILKKTVKTVSKQQQHWNY